MSQYRISDPAVEDALERLFVVEDRYFDLDRPTYVVRPRAEGDPRLTMKDAFKRLVQELRPLGHLPRLSRDIDRLRITLVRKPSARARDSRRNQLLLAATAGTIFLDGYLRSNNPILTTVLMSNVPVFVNALLFTLAILGIFGLHELGHKLMTSRSGVESSMPYFIPAPPGLGGTFGAVITQKEPPANRDDLFDLGFSGPLTGFLITILVAVLGLRLSFIVPEGQIATWMAAFPEVRFQSIPFPMLIEYLAQAISPTPPGMVLVLHPLGFAAWVGCLVTFINLIPSWQLDGGHISRALLGEMNHRIMSVAGIVIMLLSGYFIMAIMLAFFMMRSGGESGGPLDDISPLSLSRKLMSLAYLGMMILTLVVLYPF